MSKEEKKAEKKLWTQKDVEEEVKKFDEKIAAIDDTNTDALSEVELLMEKGVFLRDKAKEWDRAEETFRSALSKTGNPNRKLELLFHIMEMTINSVEVHKVHEDIDAAKEQVEKGGDWEKKNKLKVHEGLFSLMNGEFKKAAELFLDSVATFTCENVVSFKLFVFYAVVCSVVSLDRATLRKKVVHNPEILTVIKEVPHLKEFLESFFRCDYRTFFREFCEIGDKLAKDKYFSLGKNHRKWVKDARLAAYKQFLTSYKSVTIHNMADQFGVGTEFIDRELSHFISIGKLSCVIDKVEGVIQFKKEDNKMALYGKMVHTGDRLLNRMQKLGRALDV